MVRTGPTLSWRAMHSFGGSDVKVCSIDAQERCASGNFVENRE